MSEVTTRFFDGDMECEQHPGVAWPHGDCEGPGMPWSAPAYDPIGDDAHSDRMERTRVVAWLRDQAALPAYSYDTIGTSALRRAADSIEQGAHYKG